MRDIYPQTAAYLDNTEPWDDDWVGPHLVVTRETSRSSKTLVIKGWVDLSYMVKPFDLKVLVDDNEVGNARLEKSGEFALNFPLQSNLAPGKHTVEVQSSAWYVPHRFTRNGDFRPLAWKLITIEVS